jgi:hypothetical protein
VSFIINGWCVFVHFTIHGVWTLPTLSQEDRVRNLLPTSVLVTYIGYTGKWNEKYSLSDQIHNFYSGNLPDSCKNRANTLGTRYLYILTGINNPLKLSCWCCNSSLYHTQNFKTLLSKSFYRLMLSHNLTPLI